MFLQSFERETLSTQEEIFKLLLSHADKLKEFSGSFLLKVNLKEGSPLIFLVTPESIEMATTEADLPEVWVDYETLVKVLEKPSRVLRYYFQGKIKIKGDPKSILKL